MLKKGVPNEIMCTDTKKCCFEIKYVEKAVLNEIMCTDTKNAVLNENRSKDVEKGCF